ncbi:hypothetical protein C5U62_32200 [Pseudomonas protegens]|uniref:Uncharacterized protein n=1 Tax=Pseudomonas protegens TaxID=380021 RepID=A0A2T6GB69_9PSED|nr:hypothetical protein C5U62_32200 [Pseudomonas protegens]
MTHRLCETGHQVLVDIFVLLDAEVDPFTHQRHQERLSDQRMGVGDEAMPLETGVQPLALDDPAWV